VRKIVVGVDGSAHSLDALRWAVAEAALRDAEVVAVHAWCLPHVSTVHEGLHLVAIDFAPLREAARELLDAAIDEAAPDAAVEITRVVSEGPAAATLLAAAEDADLLVVGSRGLGGFKGMLLGSVSHQVAQRARCPVVVVRTPVRDEERDEEHVAAARPAG
jgi:nucleotide-binding universal stress UspA family protein